MYELTCDVAVIGAGPAGLAAAVAAKKQGAGRVLIIERDSAPGGILQQCIHPGFGLTYYDEELTGPEYAARFIGEAEKAGVEMMFDAMVLEITPEGDIICASSQKGMTAVHSKSVVLAMGCRERTHGNIAIPGTRPAGIYTAGAAQRLINRQNMMVGRRVLILGSGDIGMIMARRMTLEGAEVIAVVEIMDYLAGLTRNRVQCLQDFGIPLMLSHTVTQIIGHSRLEGCMVARVDENRRPIPGTEEFFECDTLLLSVGLIPENELSLAAKIEINGVTGGPEVDQHMQTSVPGVFACGNVVHVNDLADNVSIESELAGRSAARCAMGEQPATIRTVRCVPGENVRYICPQKITVTDRDEEVRLYFRVKEPLLGAYIGVNSGGTALSSKKAIKVNPGEMEHADINLSDLTGDRITIDVSRGD